MKGMSAFWVFRRCVSLCGACVVVLGLVCGGATPLAAQELSDYIVVFRAGAADTSRARALQEAGVTARFTYRGVAAAAVRVPGPNALAALRANPAVEAVIPDRPVMAFQSDKAQGGRKGGNGGSEGGGGEVTPAGVVRVGAPTAASNGAGVAVAILDTGVDLGHEDLSGTLDAFSAFGGSCQDDEGHGTHVAGIAAARQNGVGVVGVAPGAAVVCVKVLDGTGSGSDATVMAGLDWVLANHSAVVPPVRVVNMSLGRPGAIDDNPALRALVASVDAAGVAVVVAAGNDPNREVSEQVPAAYAADGTVIAVASTTARTGANQCRFLGAPISGDTASYFTTDGPDVLVSAPGAEAENVGKSCLISSLGIVSTRLGGGTTRLSGTSMASPHVAGVVARYFQQSLAYTTDEIRQFLQLDADRVAVAPLNSPSGSYSFDGTREGIAQAP